MSVLLTHNIEDKGKGGWSVESIGLCRVGALITVGDADGLPRIVEIT